MWGRLWGNCRGKTVGKLWGYLWRKTAERNCGGRETVGETAGGNWGETAGGTAGETVNYRMVLKKETRLRGYSTMAGGKC